jgi:ATP-binding cassette subfamily C protein
MEKVDKILVLNRGQQDLYGSRDHVFNELAARIRQVNQIPATPAPEISTTVIGVSNGPIPSSKRTSRPLGTTVVANQA